ncbi:MAG: ABC-F family ATP-binding cassette domain-containing protein [Lachnospiraceae bacterium]|nr:ABC-F family ATP-binding cassette domain-containing protein [Lachnospiraceae bacterium]
MNVLNVENVSKNYSNRDLLDHVSLGVNEGDKIGVIGLNGCGKSTFLKIVSGQVEPDEGQVVMQNGLTISFLPQDPVFCEGDTILSYVSRGKTYQDGDRSIESEAKVVCNHLGITNHLQPVQELSGGQKKRVALARCLIAPSDILVLDEPTNHLDQAMILWLQDYLKRFKGELLVVTHDRYFLDQVTNRIVEIQGGNLYSYDTNYSGVLELKVAREEMMASTEKKRQNILRTELAWIRRGAQARSTKQQARIDRFEDLRKASKEAREAMAKSTLEVSSISTRIGKKTIEVEHVSKSYKDRVVIRDFSHIVLRDERIGFVGPNGCGKSTLMKIIAGVEEPTSGTVSIGETIKIGFFRQDNSILDENQTVIEHVKDIGEYIPTVDGRITASQMCEKFLFTSKQQYTPISKLSGGEKRRLHLLSVLMEAPNVLILDEPTNDLDIETLEILEDYLDRFVGMVLVVSHDRYFLDRIVDRIFAFEGNGVITQYEGGFTDYCEKATKKGVLDLSNIYGYGEEKGNGTKDKNASECDLPSGKEQYAAMKAANQKLKFSYAEKKEYETIDDEIEALELRLKQMDEEMVKNATNAGKLAELTKEQQEVNAALEHKMERWEYLTELAEKIQQSNS